MPLSASSDESYSNKNVWHPPLRRYIVRCRDDNTLPFYDRQVDAHMYFPNDDGLVFRTYVKGQSHTTKTAFFLPGTWVNVTEIK